VMPKHFELSPHFANGKVTPTDTKTADSAIA
jgi:hypothetical protein